MITFLKFFFYFIFLSYALRLITPLVLSFFIKRFQNNMKNKFDNMNNMNFDKQNNKKNSKSKEKVGEYVDFEEID